MKITKEILEEGKSKRGAWSEKQLLLLGVTWPRKHGWMRELIGKEVSGECVAQFLALKDAHLKRKLKHRHLFTNQPEFKYPEPEQLYVAKGKPSADIVAECPFDL